MTWKILVSMVAGALTFAIGGMSFASGVDTSKCDLKHFKVTSYYSPLKGQNFYYRGNFSDEVILNGKGTHGASGRAVFNGMIAAPASYEFGTKIYFPGRGVGQVEDRGGAIVERGQRSDASYDRVDIRAGKGEDGLKRALSFGVQYIDGYICAPGVLGTQVGFDYDKFPQFKDFFHQSLWIMHLRPQRKDPRVGALQDFLIAMGYMNEGRSTQFYGNETTKAVCTFQHERMGLSKNDEACGYFGPQTRHTMKLRARDLGLVDNKFNPTLKKGDGVSVAKTTSATNVNQKIEQPKASVIIPPTLDERIIAHLFTKGEFSSFDFTRPFKKGETAKEIRILQRKLQRLGYLDKSAIISGIYDKKTIEAVFAFQLAQKILTGKEDVSIQGYFGEKTREVINSL